WGLNAWLGFIFNRKSGFKKILVESPRLSQSASCLPWLGAGLSIAFIIEMVDFSPDASRMECKVPPPARGHSVSRWRGKQQWHDSQT
ncbi:MAG: hypothetical protein WAW39_18470, partial [Prosthecobacter sp.]|uniref:hypothetical protein n=1 Tax=Prosthecobacter sp. TaxID=1965333 RepID=UPI003BB0FEDA